MNVGGSVTHKLRKTISLKSSPSGTKLINEDRSVEVYAKIIEGHEAEEQYIALGVHICFTEEDEVVPEMYYFNVFSLDRIMGFHGSFAGMTFARAHREAMQHLDRLEGTLTGQDG